MLPSTTERVSRNTSERVNQCIRRQTERNIAHFAAAGPEAIEQRLRELDHEWDVERSLETNFALVTLVGTLLGEIVDRRWHLFTAIAAGFMVEHALQGWCPPVPILRRLGFRTQAEIDQEKYALKALRGDFQHVSQASEGQGVEQALHAVRA
jgi:hypothetical protein